MNGADALQTKLVLEASALAERSARLPRPMVFTNGVFDLLHAGHVAYLHEARRRGASLVVGLNSDASARGLGKGPERPLNGWHDRALVLAGLASVDLVVGFDEPTPLALIERLRPDVYVKGGDYRIDELAETRLVRGWGGDAFALPFLPGRSTTSLVRRIRDDTRRAAFVDRDGVINRDHGYVHRWEDCEWVPGALDGLRALQDAGYRLVIVTNQSGIGRRLYDAALYQSFTTRFVAALADEGLRIEAVYHCPHRPDEGCDCRKPEPGMIQRACRELGIDAAASVLVGDQDTDLVAGRRAGVGRLIGVRTDGDAARPALAEAEATCNNLRDAAAWLLRQP